MAVSTDRGAVYDSEGLDVTRLLRERAAAGSDCVNRYDPSRRIAPADVPAVPGDFFVPCALSWSVSSANADRVQARAIVCGANNPITQKAREALGARGVTYFPDFVSNSGGVLGSILGSLALDHERIVPFIRQHFVPRVENLMAQTRQTDRSIEEVAREIAGINLEAMKQARSRRKNPLVSWVVGLGRRGRLPGVLTRTFGPAYVRKTIS